MEYIIIAYFVIGLLCSCYWFKMDYEEEYNMLLGNGKDVEKGAATMLMLYMAIFWPFVFLYKVIK